MVVATICAIINISGIAQGEYSMVVWTLVFRFAVIVVFKLNLASFSLEHVCAHHSMFAPISSNSSKIL